MDSDQRALRIVEERGADRRLQPGLERLGSLVPSRPRTSSEEMSSSLRECEQRAGNPMRFLKRGNFRQFACVRFGVCRGAHLAHGACFVGPTHTERPSLEVAHPERHFGNSKVLFH
jgi:hypothetical protein